MSDEAYRARDLRHWQFSAGEAVALTGVSSGTLQNWLARGVIRPSETQRRGPHRVFGFTDLALIAVARSLTLLRVPPSVISGVAEDVERRAATLALGCMLQPSLETMLGDLSPHWPTVLVLHPDHQDTDRWHVLQANWSESADFDPSDLPHAFLVLKLDELVGRLLEAAERMKPSLIKEPLDGMTARHGE
jgi:DNA-binding transcriptional MerR regulator